MQHPAPRTLWTKAVEAATAVALTQRYGREAVLAQYLRLVPYGNGSHGIPHAARWYFDKPVADLSWAEVALLSAIPQAPGMMNPHHLQGLARAVDRGRHMLDELARQQVINADERKLASAELDRLRLPPPPRRPEALHAILRIADMVAHDDASCVNPADPRIQTTIDLDIQSTAAVIARQQVQLWGSAGAQQVAVLVVRRQSRQVLAMVGSAGYGTAPGGAIDFTRASRSPSAL